MKKLNEKNPLFFGSINVTTEFLIRNTKKYTKCIIKHRKFERGFGRVELRVS